MDGQAKCVSYAPPSSFLSEGCLSGVLCGLEVPVTVEGVPYKLAAMAYSTIICIWTADRVSSFQATSLDGKLSAPDSHWDGDQPRQRQENKTAVSDGTKRGVLLAAGILPMLCYELCLPGPNNDRRRTILIRRRAGDAWICKTAEAERGRNAGRHKQPLSDLLFRACPDFFGIFIIHGVDEKSPSASFGVRTNSSRRWPGAKLGIGTARIQP